MSTLIRSKRLRPSLSAKPQLLTLFLQLPPPYRSFHASPHPQFLDAAINTTHTAFEGLHSITCLPWAYTIPIAALTIRTAFVLPVTYYSRRNAQKQATLTPLISAWQHSLRKEAIEEVGHLGPVMAQSTLLKKTRQKRSEIYHTFNCGQWKAGLLPLVQIPVWLMAIETLRRMCGKEAGLLGMAAGLFRGDEPTNMVETGLPIEQSFATEGALWFPDLLAPDPHMVLPFMLSGAILLNLSNANEHTVWQKRIVRSLKLVGLALGPLTLQFPSALLIYWISSSMLAYTQSVVLDRVMPIKSPVVPCKPRKPKGLPEGDLEGRL
jgi:inner membrane protein COX18